MRVTLCAVVAAGAIALAAEGAEAQRPPRRQETIEIRGQVPTPQVVTVRPREVPAYSRQVLVPNFYDHDFWPSILPPYQLVPQRLITGQLPVDSLTARADTSGAAARPPAVPPAPADSPRAASAGRTPANAARRSPGTAPARTPR